MSHDGFDLHPAGCRCKVHADEPTERDVEDMLALRFPKWKQWERDEFANRIEGIIAERIAQARREGVEHARLVHAHRVAAERPAKADALTQTERGQLSAALGYTAEVCAPNEKPVTEYITDRWGQEARARIFAAVELILSERTRPKARPLPLHRTEAGYPNCSTCDGGGCLDCTDPA